MKGLKAYQNASVEAAISVAEPYKITAMLFDALIKNMYLAKSAHEAKDYERKSASISKAQSIVTALAATLNDAAAPDLCENLRRLYDYVINSLIDYMLTGNNEKIESSISVIREIKSGWDQIENSI